MNAVRRRLLRAVAALATLVAVPKALLAAAWPERAFSATDARTAIMELFGTRETTNSDEIELTLPTVAENGATVPVTIRTTLANVRSISIVVPRNPRPLAAMFEIPPGTLPEISGRIKMAETSDVIAVVRTGSALYTAAKEVRVTIGGCA